MTDALDRLAAIIGRRCFEPVERSPLRQVYERAARRRAAELLPQTRKRDVTEVMA